jgi:myo-inositol-1(or 4)-monophosphatase
MVRIASEAAEAVAPEIRDAFFAQKDLQFKRDQHDPVTVHDRMAEERIRDVLSTRCPGSSVVGEEHGTTSGGGEVTWYVDPIDGTANFGRGYAFFCVSIAAVVEDRVVAGVVLDPVRRQLFSADGDGAYLDGRALTSQGRRQERRGLLVCGYPSTRDVDDGRDAAMRRFGRLVQAWGTVRRTGSSALSLAHVAAGWVDGTYTTRIKPWDVAAGALLVHRAGGRYVGFGGANVPVWQAPDYVALTSSIEAPVLLDLAAEVALEREGGMLAENFV